MRESFLKGAKTVVLVTVETIMQLVMALPRYKCCNAVKALFLRALGANIGRGVMFYPGVWILTGRNLVIEDHVSLARDVLIGTDGGVRIGARTLIGFRTQIFSGNHRIPPVPERIFAAGTERKPIVIGQDVWIGANCLIVAGVTIGEGAVVAGGSVVTKPVEPWTVVGGVPAKRIRYRAGAPEGPDSTASDEATETKERTHDDPS